MAEFGFLADPLAMVMLLVVTGVGFLIHVYSVGYMAHEGGYYRFFAYLNLFMFAMLLLVLADNYLLMFVGWEGVGLCSYLLIGFYFDRPAAADAGKKAFIVNRIGDFGFVIGILLLFASFGTVELPGGLRQGLDACPWRAASACSPLITLLFFVGATGKSAQIPLYVWLPDAMEGPTPVSALIHAATMVTAGVYMVARSNPLYSRAPGDPLLGGPDRLGHRLLRRHHRPVPERHQAGAGLLHRQPARLHVPRPRRGGVLGRHLPPDDPRLLQGPAVPRRRQRHPWPCTTSRTCSGWAGCASTSRSPARPCAVGTLAIAGMPFLSGFFSKDEILWKAFSSPVRGHLLFCGLATAGGGHHRVLHVPAHAPDLLRGEPAGAARKLHHVHESPKSMTVLLMILAVLSLVGGYIGLPAWLGPNWFEHFLEPVFAWLPAPGAAGRARRARPRPGAGWTGGIHRWPPCWASAWPCSSTGGAT